MFERKIRQCYRGEENAFYGWCAWIFALFWRNARDFFIPESAGSGIKKMENRDWKTENRNRDKGFCKRQTVEKK
jgi:hypothetical protein